MPTEEVLQICEAQGGALAAMARNYRAARCDTHRALIAQHLMANAPTSAWLVHYQQQAK